MRGRKVHVAETISQQALGPHATSSEVPRDSPRWCSSGLLPLPRGPCRPSDNPGFICIRGPGPLLFSFSLSLSLFLLALFLFLWTTRRGSVTGDGRRAIMATRGGNVVLKLWALVWTSGPQQRAEMKLGYLKVCQSNLRDTDILGSNVG